MAILEWDFHCPMSTSIAFPAGIRAHSVTTAMMDTRSGHQAQEDNTDRRLVRAMSSDADLIW